MSDLPLTGGCGCGAVRFELTAPLKRAVYCHCTRCQRRTGTAAGITGVAEPDSIVVVSGEDELRDWNPAGGGFIKVFCGACGSAVFVRHPETGALSGVRLGAFDGDPGIRPSVRQFVKYAAPWEPLPDDGLPRYDERMPVG